MPWPPAPRPTCAPRSSMFAGGGTRVVLVGGPRDTRACPAGPAGRSPTPTTAIVNEWAGRDIGRVRYADAAATVSGSDHTLRRPTALPGGRGRRPGLRRRRGHGAHPRPHPLLPVERARRADRVPVPSPGAERFGSEMARVARLALDPGY